MCFHYFKSKLLSIECTKVAGLVWSIAVLSILFSPLFSAERITHFEGIPPSVFILSPRNEFFTATGSVWWIHWTTLMKLAVETILNTSPEHFALQPAKSKEKTSIYIQVTVWKVWIFSDSALWSPAPRACRMLLFHLQNRCLFKWAPEWGTASFFDVFINSGPVRNGIVLKESKMGWEQKGNGGKFRRCECSECRSGGKMAHISFH